MDHTYHLRMHSVACDSWQVASRNGEVPTGLSSFFLLSRPVLHSRVLPLAGIRHWTRIVLHLVCVYFSNS